MERNRTFDVLKGIAIVLVIIGHLPGLPHFLHNFIYSFHMPLFFFVSGWFYKEKSGLAYIKADSRRLLLPYYITVFLFLLWWFVRACFRHDYRLFLNTVIVYLYGSEILADDGCSQYVPFTGDNSIPIGPIWFILSMFCCRQLYNVIRMRNIVLKLILVLMLSYIAYIIANYFYQLPFGILPGICGMTFYAIGYYVKNYGDLINKYKYFLMIFGFVIFVYCNLYSSLSMVVCHYEKYPLDIIAGCFGTWFLYVFSKLICNKFSKTRKVFSWLGINSMAILFFHFFEHQSGLWEDFLHIPNVWYVLLPVKLLFVFSLLFIGSKIKFVRNIYNIKEYRII